MRTNFFIVIKQISLRTQGRLTLEGTLWYRPGISVHSLFLTEIQRPEKYRCLCVCVYMLIVLSSVHQEGLEARIPNTGEHKASCGLV